MTRRLLRLAKVHLKIANGNLQGISRLVKGMRVEEAIAKLEGIRCGNRVTSCPDQLCKALHEIQG